MKRALIIFTRIPEAGKTKTRLMPRFDAEECAKLHICMLLDLATEVKSVEADVFVFYTGGNLSLLKNIFGNQMQYFEQQGESLGDRMYDAIRDVLNRGYDQAVLVGTDIPTLSAEIINSAFEQIDDNQITMGPTSDGGYYLIGMNKPVKEVFNLEKFSDSSVWESTAAAAEKAGYKVAKIVEQSDIDEPEDIADFRNKIRKDRKLRNSNAGKMITDSLKISIIIPTYNEESTIGKMVEQMRPYQSDAEIIFVDGGSTDKTTEILGNEFKLIKTEKGRAIQMNSAADVATGDVLFFLHCDCEIPADITGEIRRCMTGNQYGCFGVRFQSNNLFMHTNQALSNFRAFSRGLPFGDQGIFIDRELFFKIGKFPELPVMEDYELSRRLLMRGFKPGRTTNKLIASDRRYGKGTFSILKTEYKLWNYRRQYRKGTDLRDIAKEYKDIR